MVWGQRLDRPEATRESFDAQGFYKTGDVALVDERGLFHVVDRVKELIKVKGFQVAPAELEAALLGCEQIADAAVIGLPSAKHGEGKLNRIERDRGTDGNVSLW